MALLARAEQGWKKDLLSRLEAFEVAHACERERRQAALEGVRAALDAGDDAGLHAARIATKKWRYALESLGESDDPSRATPGALRPLQDVLGGILDRSALRAALAKRLREPAEVGTVRTLPALMADLEAERSELLQRFRAHGAELLRSVEAPP